MTAPTPRIRWLCLLAIALVASTLPSSSPVSVEEPAARTWRLLNTFVYEGVTHGSSVLNMMEGRANGILPTGQISLAPGEARTWVAPALSPDPVDFGEAPWTLDLSGNSVVVGAEWTVGVYEPESATYEPVAGEPTEVSGPGPTTFVPSETFTLPANAHVAVRLTAGSAPALVDAFDEFGERSPSSLSVSGGVGVRGEAERLGERLATSACHHRDLAPAAECAEDWVARRGLPESGGGSDVAVAPDGDTVYVTGAMQGQTLQTDILTIAYDADSGSPLWEDRYDGPGGPHDSPVDLLLSPDGATVYVTGRVCVVPSSNNLNCTSNYDTVVNALDAATGERTWSVLVGGEGDQRPHAAALSPDGSRLVIASHTSEIAGPADPQDVYAAAIDTATGTAVWEATYAGESDRQDYPNAVAFDEEGAVVYVVGGSAHAATGMDALVLGFDAATGQEVLVRRLDAGGGGEDRAGDVVVAGETLYVAGTGVRAPDEDRDAFLLAHDVATGTDRWLAWHDGPWDSDDNAAFVAVSPDGQTVYVTGSEGLSSTTLDAFAVAYDADSGGARWTSRFSAPGKSYDLVRDTTLTLDGSSVLLAVESGWFSNSTRDFVTLAFDAATGETVLNARYDGTGRGTEVPTAIAADPDGTQVFVTGASQGYVPTTLLVFYEIATVAYDLPG